MAILWLDLETYSDIPITCGVYKYAENAEILLFSYAFDNEPANVIDMTSEPLPERILSAFADGETTLIAHNSNFDRTILSKFYPAVKDPRRWKDSMIKAYSMSLPGALGDLCEYLGLPVDKAKDKAGKALVKLFCVPQKSPTLYTTEYKGYHRVMPANAQEEWARFVNYARLDVEAMREVWQRLPNWNDTPQFWQEWHIDQEINDRGMEIDLELAKAAIAVSDSVAANSEAAVQRVTGGKVKTAGQVSALLAFMAENYGYELPDMQAATLADALADPALPPACKELINARLAAAKASVKKYDALLECTNTDSRLRGCLLFHGSRTGRWAGRNFQPQNLPRGTLAPDEVETAIEAIKLGTAPMLYNDLNSVISSCLRGAIIAPKGKKLVVADLSNIEGRVLAWLAGEQWKIEAFRAFDAGHGVDLYKASYARTFGIDPADVTKKQRQIGKVLELAMGYAGGAGAFLAFAKNYGVDMEAMAATVLASIDRESLDGARDSYDFFASKNLTFGLSKDAFIACDAIKRAWRKAHPAIVRFWDDIGQVITSALDTRIAAPHIRDNFPVELSYEEGFLRVKLPSGRFMVYPKAALPKASDRALMTYYGQPKTARGNAIIKTNQGSMVENITQATARDILASSLAAIEAAGYKIVLSVHDELITETPDATGFSAETLAKLMATPPIWATDLPLAAAGFESYRYKKD